MCKTILVTTLCIGFAALVAYSRAQAQEAPQGPPPPGSRVIINQPMIQCDTAEQIKAIAEAKLRSDAAMAAKIDEFARIIDQGNEPSCVFGKAKFPVVVGDSVALPDLKFGNTEVHAWDILVGNARGQWHVMYVARMPSKSSKSLGVDL